MKKLILVLAAATGCSTTEAPRAPTWEGVSAQFERLMEPVRLSMRRSEFDQCYRDVVQGFIHIPPGLEAPCQPPWTLACLKSKGWYCAHGVRDGGVAAPAELGRGLDVPKVVLFDGNGRPRFQVAQEPWSRLAVIDADGDPDTLELVRWSEQSEYTRMPFLAIHRLPDLNAPPLLVLTLNPKAEEGRNLINSWEVDGVTHWSIKRNPAPNRTGRWLIENAGFRRKDIVIEEMIDGKFTVVARFTLDPGRSAFEGPKGSDDDLWKVGDDPWVAASLVDFASLPTTGTFKGGRYGEIRRNADHRKAAQEAARKAGLGK